jgi:hypothetical protein
MHPTLMVPCIFLSFNLLEGLTMAVDCSRVACAVMADKDHCHIET